MILKWQGNNQNLKWPVRAGGEHTCFNFFTPFAILPNLWCCGPPAEMVADSKMAVWQFAPPPQNPHSVPAGKSDKNQNLGNFPPRPLLLRLSNTKSRGILPTHTTLLNIKVK